MNGKPIIVKVGLGLLVLAMLIPLLLPLFGTA